MTLAQLDALIRVHNAASRRRAKTEDRGTAMSHAQWAALVTEHG